MKEAAFNLNNSIVVDSNPLKKKIIDVYNEYFNFTRPLKMEMGTSKTELHSELHLWGIFNKLYPEKFKKVCDNFYTIGVLYAFDGISYPLTFNTKIKVTEKEGEGDTKILNMEEFIIEYGESLFLGSNLSISANFDILGD